MRDSRDPRSEDTITAIATAAGGGVGIIRVSGPDAISTAVRVFRARTIDWYRHPRVMMLGRLVDPAVPPDHPDHVLDEALAVAFHEPKSMTGEDVVELHVHGGALHLRRCLDLIIRCGARLADPGEFTRRAFLNGRLDLTRAEAVSDLVSAKTDQALRQARAQLRGALHDKVMELRLRLLDLRARLEVNLDFPDEDIPPADLAVLAAAARTLGDDLLALAGTYRRGRLLREGARVVLAGPPNAGKSSLFNALVAHDRAIVTAIPGTTRDTLEETIDVLGIPVVLIDTAGLRDAGDPIEALGIQRTEDAIAAADLVLCLVPPGEEAPDLAAAQAHALVVHSKADLRDPTHERATLSVSAATGHGMDALREAIARHLDAGREADQGGLVIVHERQFQALSNAGEAALRAASLLAPSEHAQPPELAAVDLQEVMDELHALVGQTTIEDVLDRLFSSFCIGK